MSCHSYSIWGNVLCVDSLFKAVQLLSSLELRIRISVLLDCWMIPESGLLLTHKPNRFHNILLSEWYQSDVKLILDSQFGRIQPVVSALWIFHYLFPCWMVQRSPWLQTFVVYTNITWQSQPRSVFKTIVFYPEESLKSNTDAIRVWKTLNNLIYMVCWMKMCLHWQYSCVYLPLWTNICFPIHQDGSVANHLQCLHATHWDKSGSIQHMPHIPTQLTAGLDVAETSVCPLGSRVLSTTANTPRVPKDRSKVSSKCWIMYMA